MSVSKLSPAQQLMQENDVKVDAAPKGSGEDGAETPAEKEAREKQEAEAKEKEEGSGSETPAEKEAREKQEAEAKEKEDDNAETPEEKIAREKREAEEAAARNQEPPTVDEEAVKKYLKDTLNIDVTDLKDLKPKEDLSEEEQRKLQEETDGNAIKWALDNNKIKNAELKAFYLDSERTPRDVAFELFSKQRMEENKELSPEDVEEMFKSYTKEDFEDGNWEKNQKTLEMQRVHQNYLAQKYPNIINATSEYLDHVDTLDKAATYNKQVEGVFTSLKKELTFDLPVEVSEGKMEKKPFKALFNDEDVAEVKAQLLSEGSFKAIGLSGTATNEMLTTMATNALIVKSMPKIVDVVAKSYANEIKLATLAGRKGAMPGHTGDSNDEIQLPGVKTVAHALMEENRVGKK